MATFLFNNIIFGPVESRRLGKSLGINLSPEHKKVCNFNCIYCECGWTCSREPEIGSLPSRQQVMNALEMKLIEMKKRGNIPDTITFAGNGEPTLHPDFSGIIKDTVTLRNHYVPSVSIAVLSNSTGLGNKSTLDALQLVDQNILKLDTAVEGTFRRINNPPEDIHIDQIIRNLMLVESGLIIQSLFFRGSLQGETIDNTTPGEIKELLKAYRKIRPDLVMVYTFARETALKGLEKIPLIELDNIAESIRALDISVQVSS